MKMKWMVHNSRSVTFLLSFHLEHWFNEHKQRCEVQMNSKVKVVVSWKVTDFDRFDWLKCNYFEVKRMRQTLRQFLFDQQLILIGFIHSLIRTSIKWCGFVWLQSTGLDLFTQTLIELQKSHKIVSIMNFSKLHILHSFLWRFLESFLIFCYIYPMIFKFFPRIIDVYLSWEKVGKCLPQKREKFTRKFFSFPRMLENEVIKFISINLS